MHASGKKIKVLFLCTGNSCRSQMAEGFARHIKGNDLEPYSAGTRPERGVNHYAIRVMNEVGIDISGQKTKGIEMLKNIDFDLIVTLCDDAREECPVFPSGVKMIHAGFEDPFVLAEKATDEEGALNIYRRVRDNIKSWIASRQTDGGHAFHSQ